MREPTSNLSLFRDLSFLEGVVGALCWTKGGFTWKVIAAGLIFSAVLGYAIVVLEFIERRSERKVASTTRRGDSDG